MLRESSLPHSCASILFLDTEPIHVFELAATSVTSSTAPAAITSQTNRGFMYYPSTSNSYTSLPSSHLPLPPRDHLLQVLRAVARCLESVLDDLRYALAKSSHGRTSATRDCGAASIALAHDGGLRRDAAGRPLVSLACVYDECQHATS